MLIAKVQQLAIGNQHLVIDNQQLAIGNQQLAIDNQYHSVWLNSDPTNSVTASVYGGSDGVSVRRQWRS